MARVVVVGAGIGGMAAAARLRVKGHPVTVLESAPTWGGQLGSFRRDGFAFDTGATMLTLPAVYRDLFLKTGAPLEESVELQPLDPAAQYRFADGTVLTMPGAGGGRAAEAMGQALGGRAAEDWRALLARAGRMWAAIRRPLLDTAVSGPRDLLPMVRDRTTLRTLAPWQSLRGLGRAILCDPRAGQVLDLAATRLGSDPRRAPAVLATQPYVEATFGAWRIAGGLRALADALHDRLLERRVELRLGTAVTRIELAGGRVAGVRLADGGHLPADVVVANVDAAQVYGRLLGDDAPSASRRAIDGAPRSASTFTLLLAVTGRTPGIAPHTVWLTDRPDQQLDTLFARRPAPLDAPTIHACVPDDPAMRPSGHEAWVVHVDAPRHSPGGRLPGTLDWDAPGLAGEYADLVLARLAERGTDLTGRILWRELRTPADRERATDAPGGAIHGSATHGVRGGYLRPQNAAPIAGLYLVGGSTHPGGGLPRVGMSAEIVAGLVGRA